MGKRIVIIDDDHVIQESLQELFTRCRLRGFRGRLTASAGYELITREKPDMVVADILLPRMHGVALCEKIQGQRRIQAIPIILMTGVYKDVNLRMYVHKGLAEDFIEKPFREKELLAKIEHFIGAAEEKTRSAQPAAPAVPDPANGCPETPRPFAGERPG